MPDATAARDAARTALDRKHDLAVILEDALIDLHGEVENPDGPEGEGWVTRALGTLNRALEACDELEAAIAAAFNETGKLLPGATIAISRAGQGEKTEWGTRAQVIPSGRPYEQPAASEDEARATVEMMRAERPDWGAVLLRRTPARPAGPWEVAADAEPE